MLISRRCRVDSMLRFALWRWMQTGEWSDTQHRKQVQSMGRGTATPFVLEVCVMLEERCVHTACGLQNSRANTFAQANMEGWAPASEDPDGGEGYRGACCSEMSVWSVFPFL